MIRTRCSERLRAQQNYAWQDRRRRCELDTPGKFEAGGRGANMLSCRSVVKVVGSVAEIWGGTLMHILHQQARRLVAAALLCLLCPCIVSAADEPTLTKEQIKNFLLTAKIIK